MTRRAMRAALRRMCRDWNLGRLDVLERMGGV